MRVKKSPHSARKKEELPSFLKNLNKIPDDIELSERSRKSEAYLGPIFLGECILFHPPHHSVPLSTFHNGQFSAPLREYVLREIFQTQPIPIKPKVESRTFHPAIKRQKTFVDPFPHRCPGTRKVFAPETPLREGLGETVSTIEGEMSREIPFCRVKTISSGCFAMEPKMELEVVTLSDIREENRAFMSDKEQMAHAHFPKEFVTVRVVGPTIPASITITKLPSKRHGSFEINAHLRKKAKKPQDKTEQSAKRPLEDVEETEKEVKEAKESAQSFVMEKEESFEEKSDSFDKEKESSEEIENEGDRQRSLIIGEDEEEQEEEGEEGEVEVYGEVGEGEEAKEPSQVLVNEETEGSPEAAQEENPPEEAEN